MATPDGNRSDLHKHLEFIQNVIARLANNGFLVKGWSLTVTGAFYGFAVQQSEWRLALIGLLPAFAFWWLDGYFLRSEKMFRELFDDVRVSPDKHPNFELDHRPYSEKVGSPWKMMVSSTLRVFHGSIFVVGILVAAITAGCIR